MAADRSLENLIGNLHDLIEHLLLNQDRKEDDATFNKDIATAKAVSQVSSQIIEAEKTLNDRAKIIGEYTTMDVRSVAIRDMFNKKKALGHGN